MAVALAGAMLKPQIVLALALASGCGGHPPHGVHELDRGGVYVVHVERNACQGCDQLARGDLIQSVDSQPVSTAADLDRLTDEAPHQLEIWDKSAAGATADPDGEISLDIVHTINAAVLFALAEL